MANKRVENQNLKISNAFVLREIFNSKLSVWRLESEGSKSGWSIISLLLAAAEEVINLPNGELAKIYARNASPRKFQLNGYICTSIDCTNMYK